MGPFKMTQNSNNYIVVMQDHFTQWVEGRAICGKEALTIADAVVQDWILKHGTPITLRSDRGKEFTAALIERFVIYSALLKHTLWHTTHRPTAWWNVVTSWQCSEL